MKGWFNEPDRHALASRGIETSFESRAKNYSNVSISFGDVEKKNDMIYINDVPIIKIKKVKNPTVDGESVDGTIKIVSKDGNYGELIVRDKPNPPVIHEIGHFIYNYIYGAKQRESDKDYIGTEEWIQNYIIENLVEYPPEDDIEFYKNIDFHIEPIIDEAFANSFKDYWSIPDFLMEEFPKFYEFWDEIIKKNPILIDIVEGAMEITSGWRYDGKRSNKEERILNRIEEIKEDVVYR